MEKEGQEKSPFPCSLANNCLQREVYLDTTKLDPEEEDVSTSSTIDKDEPSEDAYEHVAKEICEQQRGKRSVAEFLMCKDKKGNDSRCEEIITIEDETEALRKSTVHPVRVKSIKDVLSGGFRKKQKIDITNEPVIILKEHKKPFEVTHEQLMKSFKNTRKTTVKELFNSFKSRNTGKNADGDDNAIGTEGQRPWRRLNNISSLKELEAPWPKEQMVLPCEHLPAAHLALPRKSSRAMHEFVIDHDELNSISGRNTVEVITETDAIRYPVAYSPVQSIWTENFKPSSIDDVMVASKVKYSVKSWIKTAFVKLKKPTGRVALCEKERGSTEDEFGDFIVNDLANDTSEDAEMEEFVPLMILAGETGKSTLLEVIMNELGGEIFEINTGSNRAKKNIWDNLKEFSTTHFVKNTGSKGIIVFDDVDILFCERDKNFWSVVEKTLLISRRPVVFTCRDVNNIPANFVQIARHQNSLFQIKKVKAEAILKYLRSCTDELGLEVPEALLQRIVHTSNRDIRFCIVQLHWLCIPPGQITTEKPKSPPLPSSISDYSMNADMLSATNVLENCTSNRSSFAHAHDESLLDTRIFSRNQQSEEESMKHDYLLDYRPHLVDELYAPLIPYELNIAQYLHDMLWDDKEHSIVVTRKFRVKFSYESIRFISSTIKRPKQAKFASSRVTRSSKRSTFLSEINSTETDDDMIFQDAYFDFLSTHTREKTLKDFYSCFQQLAEISSDTRAENIRVYQHTWDSLGPEHNMTSDDVVAAMLRDGLFKKLYFSKPPDPVLKLWKGEGQ